MLEKVELLERLAALWKAGGISLEEFQQQKTEVLAGIGVAPFSLRGRQKERRFGNLWWPVGGSILVGFTVLLLAARLVSSEELPSELAPALEFAREGETWTPVEAVPATFRGRYGPADCSLASQEMTGTQQIMYWTGDPPRVLRTFSRIFVSGDRLLVDGSPNAITVYEMSQGGGLVMLRNWFSDPKLASDRGPKENTACPGN